MANTDRPRGFWQHVLSSLRGESHDYTSGSLHAAILLLAIPMVLEMGLESTFAVVDIFWVNQIDAGWFGATPTQGAAAAAIGSTESLLSIVFAIAIGIASPSSHAWSLRWSADGGAVAALCDGRVLGFLCSRRMAAYSHHLTKDCPWGHVWRPDVFEAIYGRLAN